jgi:hypothetical protein
VEPEAPGASERGPFEEREKLGAATVSATGTVDVWLPDVPVMTRFVVVSGALLLAVSVKIDCETVGLGEKEAETPFGNPASERVTLPSNPFSGFKYK